MADYGYPWFAVGLSLLTFQAMERCRPWQGKGLLLPGLCTASTQVACHAFCFLSRTVAALSPLPHESQCPTHLTMRRAHSLILFRSPSPLQISVPGFALLCPVEIAALPLAPTSPSPSGIEFGDGPTGPLQILGMESSWDLLGNTHTATSWQRNITRDRTDRGVWLS